MIFKMSLKRLDELKNCLYHGPDPLLEALRDHKEVTEEWEEDSQTQTDNVVLELSQIEKMDLRRCEEEFLVTTVFPSMLKQDLTMMCLDLIPIRENLMVSHLLVPWIKEGRGELPLELTQALTSSSQGLILQALVDQDRPDWKWLESLSKLELSETKVQTALAAILLKQGSNKDLSLGKMMLSTLKRLPHRIEASAFERWSQAVTLHESFLTKLCRTQLNKRQF